MLKLLHTSMDLIISKNW